MPKLVLDDGRELELGRWVTVAQYCKLFNRKLSTVDSWIVRKQLPADRFVIIAELNNLKLLLAEPFGD